MPVNTLADLLLSGFEHVTLVPMRHYYTADAIRAAEAPCWPACPMVC